MELSVWIPTVISLLSLYWNYRQSRQIVVLESEAERDNLIHKFQFEKEFAFYQKLWAKLIDLRNDVTALRPIMDSHPADMTDEQVREQRLNKFAASFNAVIAIFDKHKPFYSERVHTEVLSLIKISRLEATHYQYDSRREHGMEYWDLAEKNTKEIVAKIDNICKLIRLRITPK
ncbi:MAG TPA: hypothetical protein VK658_15035 [Chryseolinea sp.]|nr:hypothetical protein [Chryseolinea sp.]